MPIPKNVSVPNFPGAKRLLELYYDGFSMNAMAEDPVICKTMLEGVANARTRSWEVSHRIKALVQSGIIPDRRFIDSTIKETGGREIAVVVGDIHAPYQDDKALEVAKQVIVDVQPDYLFINGDHVDFYQISRYDSKPQRKLELQSDLDVAKSILQDLREVAPNAQMVLRKGNHEARLDHWRSKNPEMGILTCLKLESLLELKDIDCELLEEHAPFSWHGWTITHGHLCRKLAGYTAQGMIDKYGTNGISNHIHRLAMVERTNMARSFVWVENGCLCQLKPEYSELADWAHGFTVLTYEQGQVWEEVVRINDGETMFRGRHIKA